ncbi:MAG: nucleotidyltransferase domain-containing protein, partial [Chloroflexota bacterium]
MSITPTPYPKINALLLEILAVLRNVLGENLRGLYLYGSLVGGGFVEDVSDIDLFALLDLELNETEFE